MSETASTPFERASWRVFFVASALLFFWLIIRPLLAPVVLAILVAVLFAPVHQRIEARLGHSRPRAAVASLAVIGLGVGAPATGIAILFFAQTRSLLGELVGAQEVRSRLVRVLYHALDWVAVHLRLFLGSSLDSGSLGEQVTRHVGGLLSASLPDALAQTASLLLAFVVFLIVLFYLLLRGHELLELAIDLAPLAPGHSALILTRLKATVQGVFLGGLLTAMVQGIVGCIAFWLTGFESFLIWGLLIAVASFIPVIGTGLIWVPVALSLFVTEHFNQAILMTSFGVLISTVDNLVRAIFIHRRSDVPSLLLLFSLVGGLKSTGLMGLVYGPLLAACLTEAVHIYRVEFTDRRPWGGLREPVAETPSAEPPDEVGVGSPS